VLTTSSRPSATLGTGLWETARVLRFDMVLLS